MPRELSPQDWLDELEAGMEYRRRFGLEDMWGQFEAIYYNTHESMMNDGPNLFLSQGDAMLSTVTVPSPRVKVGPVKPEEVDKAPIVESLDNVLLRDMDVASEVESATLHAYLFGRGILKIGYDSEWGYDPSFDVGGDLQLGFTLTQLNSNAKRRIEYDANISPGLPWVRAVMPHDVIVPWGVKTLETSPWIAHRIVRHIDDLRSDPKYTNTRNLQPQLSMEDFVNSYRQTKRSKFSKLNSHQATHVEMFEIMDRRTGKIYVVTWDWPKFLRNDFNALQIENRLPYVSMNFTPTTRSFWTTPDVYYLYHIQNEISDVARQRTKQRRISTLKFLYDGQVISEAELQKILSPDVGVAAQIEGGQDITKAVLKLDNVPNQVLAQEEELLRSNAREQIGFSRNQVGEFTGGRKTATEVAAVDNASRLRMSRRGLAIKRLYEDAIRTINGVVFSYWTLPRYVQVIGEEQSQKWMAINGPSLKGRYDYNVEFTEQGELQARKLEALNLYGMLSQDPSVNPEELRNYLTNQINDPAFSRLFNANVRPAVSEVSGNGGGPVRSQPPGGGARQLSQMQQQNGQANQPPAKGLLA